MMASSPDPRIPKPELRPEAKEAPKPPRGAKLPPSAALELARSPAAERPTAEPSPPAHLQVAAERYGEIRVELDPSTRTYWCFLRPSGRGSFTPGLLGDLSRMQRSIRRLCAGSAGYDDLPIRTFVVGSSTPTIFNLGGDLDLLVARIRAGDRDGLSAYARACIEVVYHNAVDYDLPIVTIALVQGDALGGGFEAALSCDVIVAERGAKFGLPEILFNLFPGMGAYSLLSRRLGAAKAEAIILSGRLYDAEELHAMGLVQVLAEPGRGAEAVRAFIARGSRRHVAQSAVYRAGRCVNPLTLDELQEVTNLWVEAALNLSDADIRKMERLVAAQDRRRESGALLAAAE